MRGNDPTAAAELADRYGEGAGNAEALIEANAARFSQELVAAQLLPPDYEATDALDLDEVAKLAALGNEAKLVSATVRHGAGDDDGGYVVYAAETPDGRTFKDVLSRDDGELSAPSGPRTSRDVHRASVQADVQARHKAAAAIADAEAQAAKARDEALADAQKTIDEAHEEAAEIKRQAAEDAAKGESKPKSSKPAGRGSAQAKPSTS